MYLPRMSMAELAGEVSAYLRTTVDDATGPKGQYGIDLYWNMGGLQASASGDAGDNESGPTLIQAVEKQLGIASAVKESAGGRSDR
jgi:uncharacterized protein (TIGR03435 family)